MEEDKEKHKKKIRKFKERHKGEEVFRREGRWWARREVDDEESHDKMERVVEHNVLDVVSLVAILGYLCSQDTVYTRTNGV